MYRPIDMDEVLRFHIGAQMIVMRLSKNEMQV
jgi:hypothetical protein